MRRAENRRRQLWPRAAVVGILAGLMAVAFRGVLLLGDQWRNAAIGNAQNWGLIGILVPMLIGAIGAGLGVWLVQRFAPETAGSGIPHLRAVILRWRGMVPGRILPIKFLGGVLAIGSGMALGREGPTVQMGGTLGFVAADFFKSSRRERATLIAAGAGAGLAAAFNAPLAGLMFVLEEMRRDFQPSVFSAAFVACIAGDVMTRVFVGPFPAFRVAQLPTPAVSSLPFFIVMGALAGLLGVAFNRSLIFSLNCFQKTRHWPRGLPAALVGAIIGAIGFFNPDLLGGGHHLAEETLAGRVALTALPLIFVARFLMTMTSYGTGAAGGIFAPLLVLGGQIGLFCGLISDKFFPDAATTPQAFAVVGMAAYFTAIVRAPLTGIVLISEMTGGYALMLPLLAACCAAYGVAELFEEEPIYEALLARSLKPRHAGSHGEWSD